MEPIISDSRSPLSRGLGTAVAVVAVLVLLGGAGFGIYALVGSSGDDAADGGGTPATAVATTLATAATPATESQSGGPTTTSTAVPPSAAPPVPPDLLLADPTPALQQVATAIGAPYRAREIDLYGGYAIVQYQDPAAPTHVDTRTWRDGVVDDARAVSLPSGFDADVEADLFDPAEVRFDLVPSLVAQAAGMFPDVEHPVASHIIVDRFRPFDDRVNIRVYVSDPERGGGGYVRFLADGTFVAVVS